MDGYDRGKQGREAEESVCGCESVRRVAPVSALLPSESLIVKGVACGDEVERVEWIVYA